MSADGVSLTDEQIDERLDAIQAAIETAIRAARDVRSYCASEIATTKAASLCAERADADNERCMVYKAGIRATHDAYLALITTYDDSAAKWLETGLENDNDVTTPLRPLQRAMCLPASSWLLIKLNVCLHCSW